MNKKRILELLTEEKVQDYTYLILFFVIFSFFSIFAIRPNISTAFNLNKELNELRLQDEQTEQKIIQIVNYQSFIEDYRDSLVMLDEAIPTSPQVSSVVEDIRESATSSAMVIMSLKVASIDFFEETNNQMQFFQIDIKATATRTSILDFINDLTQQRRLKIIRSLDMSDSSEAQDNTSFDITLVVGGYYL